MRTIFNNIISNKNLEPNSALDYIYNLDMVWYKHDSKKVLKGIIVNNVKQLDPGDYSFNIKGQCEVYRCSYGWAFVENTEKNIKLLKQIEDEEIILKTQKTKINSLRNKLNRLYNG